MTILSHCPPDLQARIRGLSRQPGDNPETYRLSLGEAWEQALAIALTAKGLPSYRANQRFINGTQLQTNRERGKCKITRHAGMTWPPGHDPGLLRPHQRDVLVKVTKVKRLSLEVKALTPAAWVAPAIHVGCCPKWDLKHFRVDALVLINNETGEAFVAPPAGEWLRVRSLYGTETDYAVPRHLLSPLDAWIDFTRATWGL